VRSRNAYSQSAQSLIRWGGAITLAYFAEHAIVALAGHQTQVSVITHIDGLMFTFRDGPIGATRWPRPGTPAGTRAYGA